MTQLFDPRRSLLVPVILVGFVLAGCLGANSSKGRGPLGEGETISWNLSGMGGANSAVGQEIVDSTTIRVHVDQWPVEDFTGDEWLAKSVIERPDAVTITLRVSDAYRARIAGHPTIGWYDTGGWVNITLRERLGGRALIDGATGERHAGS